MGGFADDLSGASLGIESIKLSPKIPFQWASGFKMPIYNDNRMLLGDIKHRILVTSALFSLIDKHKASFDYIAGTSTAGIAPAASVANVCNVPLVIVQQGTPYLFEQQYKIDACDYTMDDDPTTAIASTCPWGIPFGVTLANEVKLPFMYVRQKQKQHGKKQQVEGIIRGGEQIILVDYNMGESYEDLAVDALEKGQAYVIGVESEDISDIVKPVNLEGKRVLMIEDLISTGGSSAKEVQAIRGLGGTCDYCFSIFSYELDKADQAFGELDPVCTVDSALNYSTLLEYAKRTKYLSDTDIDLLREWRADPFGWGEKHGFPKVEKK